jgi:hypothetical protein
MATIPEITDRLEAATEKAENASQIMYDVANGDASTEVPTASGPTPTLKKWFQDLGSSVEPMLAGIPARLDRAVLRYITMSSANSAAAELPDGQIVAVYENLNTYTVSSGILTNEMPSYPAGVGTSGRSQQGRNGDTVSVLDYVGATADDVFAAAAADANGRTVDVPAGTYNITKPAPTAAHWHLRSGAVITGLPESLTVMDTSRLTGSVFTEKCGSGIGGLKIAIAISFRGDCARCQQTETQ